MNAWWIAYGDSTLVPGTGPEDAFALEGRNVQAVVSRDPDHGWQLWTRGDFYVYHPGADSWCPADHFGLYDYLLLPGPKKVLFGRTMFDPDYYALLAWLQQHPDLPLKTGWRPGEQSRA